MIVLASASQARQSILQNAGLSFKCQPADIDEGQILTSLSAKGTPPQDITLELAKQKALHIASQNPGALIIGADQTLVFENRILTKSKTPEEGLSQLETLSGKTHTLISAVCIAKDHEILWFHVNQAALTMHDLDKPALIAITDRDPKALTSCVGGYRIEGPGAWLFKEIDGDLFTIMGLPLPPLLTYLRQQQGLLP
ncbi:MAG: Maf-like protein [Alphaproteobacteria bacterium]|nr:Maf-like protein [Alphaproteobacteria bacterium]